jgi:hypothetical protein
LASSASQYCILKVSLGVHSFSWPLSRPASVLLLIVSSAFLRVCYLFAFLILLVIGLHPVERTGFLLDYDRFFLLDWLKIVKAIWNGGVITGKDILFVVRHANWLWIYNYILSAI